MILFSVYNFYKIFGSLEHEILIPETLKNYAESLYHHQNLPTPIIHTFPTFPAFSKKLILNKENVIVCLSGGIDSVATTVFALSKGFNVFPVFIKNLNTTSAREEEACKKVCSAYDLTLNIILHETKCKEINGYKKIGLKENPAKNQYIWFLCLPLLVEFQCKRIMFGDESDFQGTHFSDMPQSFTTFKPFIENQIGQEIIFETAFKNKKAGLKFIFETDPTLFSKTYSCYLPLRFFSQHNKRTKAPQNLCFSCFKCKRIKELALEIGVDLYLK